MANELEQLAMAQAVYSAIGAMVKTGEPDNLRGYVDAMLRADYEQKGTDRFRIKVNGEEVGSISARFTKPTVRIFVEDEDAFMEWLATDGEGYLRKFVRSAKGRALVDYMASALVTDGEIPGGCSAYEEPAQWAGTTIRGCDIGKVAAASGMTLPEAVIGLLNSGGE